MHLDEPRAFGIGENIALGANVCELVLLMLPIVSAWSDLMTIASSYHLSLDKALQSIDFPIALSLHKLDLTEGTLTNDLESLVILLPFGGSEETEEVGFHLLSVILLLLLATIRDIWVLQNLCELLCSA